MKLKCTISYDGSEFSGFQLQPYGRTVQGEIEKALRKLHKGTEIKIIASGRTDAGVHAAGQVIHFETNLAIPNQKWPAALNSLLPEDIALLNVQPAPEDFHARFQVKKKEYRYHVSLSPVRNVYNRKYAFSYPYQLDIDSMRKAAALMEGTHDFTSFCSIKTAVENRIRTIYSFQLVEEGSMLYFHVTGSGFLYNMVRIMVGTLLEVGRKKIFPEDIPRILEARNRAESGRTVPGHGLYLWKVSYDN
ncbi:tRNA pseudouridine(38-40) synthase TruA [Metabacillus lacus]|uniref:tRNA pseudouridine(38-40) synthase TruA n=1 Tax=Metabacillus lacus TaxID=1983721 RepID=UPI0031B5D7B9